MVAQARIELATPRSSGECSTTELPGHALRKAERLYQSTKKGGRVDFWLTQHIIPKLSKFRGAVAQLIERYIRIVEVEGLSPFSSTTQEKKLWKWRFNH